MKSNELFENAELYKKDAKNLVKNDQEVPLLIYSGWPLKALLGWEKIMRMFNSRYLTLFFL